MSILKAVNVVLRNVNCPRFGATEPPRVSDLVSGRFFFLSSIPQVCDRMSVLCRSPTSHHRGGTGRNTTYVE